MVKRPLSVCKDGYFLRSSGGECGRVVIDGGSILHDLKSWTGIMRSQMWSNDWGRGGTLGELLNTWSLGKRRPITIFILAGQAEMQVRRVW